MKLLRSLFLILLLIPVVSLANSASQQLGRLLFPMKSMTATFQQANVGKNSFGSQKSSGVVAMARPGRFRWDVTSPSKQLLVTNGKMVWYYDADLQQVTIQPLTAKQANSPAQLLSGSMTDITQQFTISMMKKTGPGQWFLLLPKQDNSQFTNIQLHFLNGKLRSMLLKDHLGQQSLIHFYHITLNPKIAANVFSFSPPKGVDVLRN